MKKNISLIIIFFIAFFVSAESLSIIEMQKNAELALQENDIYKAIAYFKDIIEINNSFFDTHLGLSRAYFLIGEYDEAYIHINNAVFLNKNSIEARILSGRILTGKGEFLKAGLIFNKILDLQKNNIEAILGMAELEVAQGHILNAIELYKNALLKSPDNRKALISSIILFDSINKTDISSNYVDQILALYPENSYVNYIAGKHYFESDNFYASLLYAKRSYNLDFNNKDTIYLLSLIHITLENYETAIELIETFLETNRDDPEIWYLLGEVYSKLGKIDKSIFCYATSLSYGSQNELSLIALENTLIKFKPIDDPVRKKYAMLHFKNGIDLINKNYSVQARSEFRRGLQLDPHSIDGQLLYAELVKANGFFNKYLSLLEKISLERPNDINLADKVEIYNSIVLDTVSGNWGIDQFIQNVPRFNLQLFISKTSVPLNTYNEGVHLGSYFLHSLHGYENIEATFNPDPTNFNNAYKISRESGSDYFLIFDFLDTKRSFSVSVKIYHSITGSVLLTIPVFKTGNQKIITSIQKISRIISESLPVKGNILERKFDKILLNTGNIQGTTVGDIFYIIRSEDLSLKKEKIGLNFDPALLLGEVEITKTDDLVSEGILTKYSFFDLINPGDSLIKKTESMERSNPDISEIVQSVPIDIYNSIISIP